MIVVQFFPSETSEPDKFAKIVNSDFPGNYFQSYDVGRMVGLSGLALARITSSLMIMTSDGQKANIGLSLKYEARGLKVMNYSRKNRNVWEFSYRAIELIREYLVGSVESRGSIALIIPVGEIPRSASDPSK